ncbi:helix-turn-helix domain-containing protein [Actinomadura barringtoniae]|nr:helix-turn-helix domain-containing protein [Actinomadura barringtoniae]
MDVDEYATSPPRGERDAPTRPEHDSGGKEVNVQAYTVEQVAETLQIGRDKVYFLLRTGQLHSIKIGKLRRITDRHLAEFIASLESADEKS